MFFFSGGKSKILIGQTHFCITISKAKYHQKFERTEGNFFPIPCKTFLFVKLCSREEACVWFKVENHLRCGSLMNSHLFRVHCTFRKPTFWLQRWMPSNTTNHKIVVVVEKKLGLWPGDQHCTHKACMAYELYLSCEKKCYILTLPHTPRYYCKICTCNSWPSYLQPCSHCGFKHGKDIGPDDWI